MQYYYLIDIRDSVFCQPNTLAAKDYCKGDNEKGERQIKSHENRRGSEGYVQKN